MSSRSSASDRFRQSSTSVVARACTAGAGGFGALGLASRLRDAE